LLSLEIREVCLEVGFAVPIKMMVMFRFIWSITFDTTRPLEMIYKYGVASLPAIFALQDTGVTT